MVHRPRRQIGVGLADPRPGVAQGDATLQHGVEHLVAKGHLGGTLRHVPGGEKVFEYVVDLIMGIQPVIVGIHPKIPLVMVHFL